MALLMLLCHTSVLFVPLVYFKMAGWLRGIVKEVVSGDTVVVVAATQGPAVPPEKRLTLSSLIAPRLVRLD
jgi:staphylococcal nuclease domain-containing protein 1